MKLIVCDFYLVCVLTGLRYRRGVFYLVVFVVGCVEVVWGGGRVDGCYIVIIISVVFVCVVNIV